MQYTIVRKNDAPTGEFNQWVFKTMEGEHVVRHGIAASQVEATLKAKGLVQEETAKIVFPED